MTTRNLMLNLDALHHHTRDDTWRYPTEGLPNLNGVHVNSAGRQLHVVAAPASSTRVVATVLYEAQPVFAVVGDRTAEARDASGWRWSWPFFPIEIEDVELLLQFDLEVIQELGDSRSYAGADGRELVFKEMMAHYHNGCHLDCATHAEWRELVGTGVVADDDDGRWSVDKIYEEYGGEGHNTVAFVGIVAEAVHQAYPTNTPSTRGF